MRSSQKGKQLILPQGNFNRVYILAASSEGDQRATFRVGDAPVDLTIQNWGGFIGQWDDRMWSRQQEQVPPRADAPPPPPELLRACALISNMLD